MLADFKECPFLFKTYGTDPDAPYTKLSDHGSTGFYVDATMFRENVLTKHFVI